MLAIWLKFCQLFVYVLYEKTKNIWEKCLINKQEQKGFEINKRKSCKNCKHWTVFKCKLDRRTRSFIRYSRVGQSFAVPCLVFLVKDAWNLHRHDLIFSWTADIRTQAIYTKGCKKFLKRCFHHYILMFEFIDVDC